jgi:hypothetical protein
MDDTRLPPLPLEEWEPTKDTLHLWAQVVGKTRLALMPMRNHWWNVTLYPSARGLTTRRMPVAAHNLEIEIDLVDHRLWARTTESEADFELHDGLSVADFHRHLTDTLNVVGVSVDIRAEPFGVPTTTPFPADREHASYDADAVTRFLRVLQWSADVLEEFAGWYCGKTSPVHLFWHGFDLAVSRVLRQAGGAEAGRRRGHHGGVLARGHQLRLRGGRPNQPVPRLLLLHRPRACRAAGADAAPSDRRMAPVRRRLARDSPLRRREDLA